MGQALMLHDTVPGTVTARVEDGMVRLGGTVTWHWQRDEAERVCPAVAGVLAVSSEIELVPAPACADIQQAIMAAFRRNARLTLDDLSVDVARTGIVILSGTVTSWAEHDDDRITVVY